jgi:hypothetical protein
LNERRFAERVEGEAQAQEGVLITFSSAEMICSGGAGFEITGTSGRSGLINIDR